MTNLDPRERAVTMAAVRIPVNAEALVGDLGQPEAPRGIVIFAHGSGSSRYSPRNRFVARSLERRGFATLLIDLLTEHEDAVDQRTGQLRFDIGLLARRLIAIIDWVKAQPSIARLPIGLFGASTGGGAALVAAAARPTSVSAVVSRGGRPDLAGDALPTVTTPTLLIVGGDDDVVIAMNRDAMSEMTGKVTLEIVPGATHLFEEPGALEEVAEHAGDWFEKYLAAAAPRPASRDASAPR